MKDLFFLLFLLLSIPSYSQQFFFILKQGANYPKMVSPKHPDEFASFSKENQKTTYLPGIGLSCALTGFFSLKTEVMREERGFYGKVFTIDPTNGALQTDVKTDFYYAFLTIPFLLEANAGNKIQIFANGGINSSRRIGGATIINDRKTVSLAFIHPEARTPKWDFSWTAGIGTRAKLSNSLFILAEGRYYRSFTPIGEVLIENEIYHKGHTLSIGLEINLKARQKK